MIRGILTLVFAGFVATSLGDDPSHPLPKPHYEPQASDPAWLSAAVQFHGHLGPWVVAGTRFGMAGLKAVGAHGYFDVEIECQGPFAKPPKACFLDGLQVGTGATLGKRTLRWTENEKIIVRVKNLRSGKTAVMRPTSDLLRQLASLKSSPLSDADHEDHANHHQRAPAEVEALAHKVAAMNDADIVEIGLNGGPEPARP